MATVMMRRFRLTVFVFLITVMSAALYVPTYASDIVMNSSAETPAGDFVPAPSSFVVNIADTDVIMEEGFVNEEVVGATTGGNAGEFTGNVIGASVTGKIRYDISYGFFDLLNAYRKQRGVKGLTMDRKLLEHAQKRAAELFALYDHVQPDGSSCFAGLSHAGGEIIFILPEGNAQNFFNGFKASSAHNSIMLGSDFSVCGVGVVELSSGWVAMSVDFCYASESSAASRRSDKVTTTQKFNVNKNNVKIGAKETEVKGGSVKLTPVGIEYYIDTGYAALYYDVAVSGVKFTTSTPAIATITGDGVVTPKGVGQGVFYATYNGKSNKFYLDIDSGNLSTSGSSYCTTTYAYTGSQIKAEPKVFYNGSLLTNGKDYKLAYESNVNVGKGKAIATGIGNYQGTTVCSFKIKSGSIASATVSGLEEYYEYTGKAVSPSFRLVINGKTLSAGTDYQYTLKNNTAVGKATISVTGLGNFEGSSRTLTFNIAKNVISENAVSGISSKVNYTGSPVTMPIKITHNNGILKENSHYKVTYKNNINAGTATVTITGLNGYYANITRTFEIAKVNISSAVLEEKPNASYVYRSSAISPAIKLSWNGKILVKDTDYTITYSNNTNVGTATINLTGKNNFTSSRTLTFKITAANLSAASVTGFKGSYPYRGRAYNVPSTVRVGGYVMKKGTDYTVSYKNNLNAGKGTMTVTGKGNCSGSKSVTFTITPLSLTSVSAANKMSNESLSSSSNLSVYAGNTKLKCGTEYKATHTKQDGTTVKVTVSGVGNYAGTICKTYKMIAPLKSGTYYMYVKISGTYKVMEVQNGSRWNGGNIQLASRNSSSRQKFKVTRLSDGTYRIINVNSGKAVEVAGGSKYNGANVRQYDWRSSANQKWVITSNDGKYWQVRAAHVNKVMDVAGGRAVNGANVQIYAPNGSAGQKISFVP